MLFWISMDILPPMKKTKTKRPAILVRMYAEDIKRLSETTARRCTPRENYCRQAILAQLTKDEEKPKKKGKPWIKTAEKPSVYIQENPTEKPTDSKPARKPRAKKAKADIQ